MASLSSFSRYYACAAAYEFGHKAFALREDRLRVRTPEWYACYSAPKTPACSRPLLITERVLATAAGMLYAPLLLPLHVADDVIRAECRLRGVKGVADDTEHLTAWMNAIVY